jgi:hypothetical protein
MVIIWVMLTFKSGTWSLKDQKVLALVGGTAFEDPNSKNSEINPLGYNIPCVFQFDSFFQTVTHAF